MRAHRNRFGSDNPLYPNYNWSQKKGKEKKEKAESVNCDVIFI